MGFSTRFLSILTTLIATAAFGGTRAPEPTPDLKGPLPNLHVVNDHLVRGGRPTSAGLKLLAAQGIKTIIDLEDTNNIVTAEIKAAAKVGINVLSYQMSAYWAPSSAKMKQIQDDLQNPALYPIYLHCHHGEDRTGLIMGVYRVTVDQWTQQAAYNEMIADGFHPAFIALDRDFWKLTTPP